MVYDLVSNHLSPALSAGHSIRGRTIVFPSLSFVSYHTQLIVIMQAVLRVKDDVEHLSLSTSTGTVSALFVGREMIGVDCLFDVGGI